MAEGCEGDLCCLGRHEGLSQGRGSCTSVSACPAHFRIGDGWAVGDCTRAISASFLGLESPSGEGGVSFWSLGLFTNLRVGFFPPCPPKGLFYETDAVSGKASLP